MANVRRREIDIDECCDDLCGILGETFEVPLRALATTYEPLYHQAREEIITLRRTLGMCIARYWSLYCWDYRVGYQRRPAVVLVNIPQVLVKLRQLQSLYILLDDVARWLCATRCGLRLDSGRNRTPRQLHRYTAKARRSFLEVSQWLQILGGEQAIRDMYALTCDTTVPENDGEVPGYVYS